MFNRASRLTAACLVVAFGVALNACARADTPTAVTYRTQTMGTWGSLTLVTADSAAAAGTAYDALVRFHYVDSLMSNWTDNSEVARINRMAASYEITIHPHVSEVLDFALRVSRESDGAFDITVEPLVRLWGFLGGEKRVPKQGEITSALQTVGYKKIYFNAANRTIHFERDGIRVDLGGVAKGHAADLAADVLHSLDVTNALVDLSGNMVAIGNAPGREGWTVGLRDPESDGTYIARVRLQDRAIATSGDYEQFIDKDGRRHGHVLDPRTGWSAQGLVSVTVITDSAMKADAWATALFVLGPEKARQAATTRTDMAAVLLEPNGEGTYTLWVEEEARVIVELSSLPQDRFRVRYF